MTARKMCAEADAMVGALYDAMQRLGLADSTWFMFTSDHGELALEHQDWYKMSFYDRTIMITCSPVTTTPTNKPWSAG